MNNNNESEDEEQYWNLEQNDDLNHIRPPDMPYAETLLGDMPSTAFGYTNENILSNEEDLELQQALLASINFVPPRPIAPRPRPSLPKKSYAEIKQKVARLVSLGDKQNKEEYELILSVLTIYEDGLLEQPYAIYDPEQYKALEQLNKSFRLKTCSLMDLFVLCS